jgi:hypothetical protein
MARSAPAAGDRTENSRGAPARRWLAVGCLLGCVGAWGWAVTAAHAAARAEQCWQEAQRLEEKIGQNNWAVANADCARLIALTREAVRRQPRNVRYRYWLNVRRWRSVSRVVDPRTGKAILGPVALRAARQIAADVERAAALCPTFGPTYSLAGQLKTFVLGAPEGAALIRQGRALAPCDPAACLAGGVLEAREGNSAAALAMFRRALSRQCGNVRWRLEFARALAAMGQTAQARQQAGICLKLMPGMPDARRLISDL